MPFEILDVYIGCSTLWSSALGVAVVLVEGLQACALSLTASAVGIHLFTLFQPVPCLLLGADWLHLWWASGLYCHITFIFITFPGRYPYPNHS